MTEQNPEAKGRKISEVLHVALLVPMDTTGRNKKKRANTKVNHAAFRAAAGSWKDVDVEQFKGGLYGENLVAPGEDGEHLAQFC
jgi:hypothetical protein